MENEEQKQKIKNLLRESEYFAEADSKEIVGKCLDRVEKYYDNLQHTGRMTLYRRAHEQYYIAQFTAGDLPKAGEKLEKRRIYINDFRNILKHLQVMTTNKRPAFKPKAINTDHKSASQTLLAKNCLDYYMYEREFEKEDTHAVERAAYLGEGWTAIEWNPNAGRVKEKTDYFIDETKHDIVYSVTYDLLNQERDENGKKQGYKIINQEGDPEKIRSDSIIKKSDYKHEGDLEVYTTGPIDVIRDYSKKELKYNTWYILRKWVNKYDLAAMYKDFKDEIEDLNYTYNYDKLLDLRQQEDIENGDILPVYTLFHKRTPAIPEGRQVVFVQGIDIPLFDNDLLYDDLPLIDLIPDVQRESNHGYTIGFDLLPVQKASDALNSAIITAQTTLGEQKILASKGSNVTAQDIAEGLTLIEYSGERAPEAWTPLNTPKELFDNIDRLDKKMEVISAVNSVTRGQPEASLKSGSALALVQSMAIEFSHNMQKAHASYLEKFGTCLIRTLQAFAPAELIEEITGKMMKQYISDFKINELHEIDRVEVEQVNPMSKTISGKTEMAQTYLQQGWIKSPDQYVEVLNTGNIDNLTESITSDLMNIRRENEMLTAGQKPPVVWTDKHQMHIQRHTADILNNPDVRRNADIIQNVTMHVQEHIAVLADYSMNNPQALIMSGQQPINISPPGPGPAQSGPPPQAGQPGPPPTEKMETAQGPDVQMPNMPNNPLTGEDFNTENGGLPE